MQFYCDLYINFIQIIYRKIHEIVQYYFSFRLDPDPEFGKSRIPDPDRVENNMDLPIMLKNK